jgi:hypothetical protein
MRGYIAVTPDELAQLIHQGELSVDTAFVATTNFKSTNSDLGEEESEYILSLLAAEDSISFQEDSAEYSFALAVDLDSSQLGKESEVEIELNSAIKFSQADCLFVGEANSQEGELTWYAAQEIAAQLPNWLGK